MSNLKETPEQYEARLQRILKQVEQQLRGALPNPYQAVEKTESQVHEIGEKIKQVIEKETLAEASEKQAPLARQVVCACGKPARYVASRSRQLVTINGVYTLWRAYYCCRACQKGFCPLDQVWELGTGAFSVGGRALACRFASYLPFAVAVRELEATRGISLSANSARRVAEAVGEQLQKDWANKEKPLWEPPETPSGKRAKGLHTTMDGVMILIGKEWKEVKVGCTYEPTAEVRVRRPRYYATLSNSQAFGKRIRTLAYTSGADTCPKMGILADGAEWIWQEAGKYFPTQVQIVDYYHVVEHLWEVAAARFGKEGNAAQTWIDQPQERLLSNKVGEVIQDIGKWAAQTQTHQDIRRRIANYLHPHPERMQYQTFREQGYHIGSGIAEASCKNVVQARFKGTGMRWSSEGAEAMLHLRAAWCSSDYIDFRDAVRRA
jgi:hypothetical protein